MERRVLVVVVGGGRTEDSRATALGVVEITAVTSPILGTLVNWLRSWPGLASGRDSVSSGSINRVDRL